MPGFSASEPRADPGSSAGELVFFTVFYNVHQGVRQVDPVVLASVRMLGASRRQLLRHVYVPSALGYMFGSLHSAVGLAVVGAVVGEYLGSAMGVGYLIHQAEGVFDASTVVAGILVLTVCALCLDAAVTWLEKRLLHWRPPGPAGCQCRPRPGLSASALYSRKSR